MSRFVLAVDPGLSEPFGSYAVLHITDDPHIRLHYWKSLKNNPNWKHDLYLMCKLCSPITTVVEDVHAFPLMGVVSAFTFGQAFEGAYCAMEVAGREPRLYDPKAWQRRLGLPHHSDIPTKSKRRTAHRKSQKELAVKLFPEIAAKNAPKGDVYASILIAYATALDLLGIPLGELLCEQEK